MRDQQLVVLFEGDAGGPGLRLVDRTRDPQLVRQVRQWFATRRRAELAEIEPPVRLVPAEPPPSEDEDR